MMYDKQTTSTNSEFHRNPHGTSARSSETPSRRKGNPIVEETNKGLMQLVEINRALAQDLDLSRRMVAELSREKDDLLHQNEILRIEKDTFQMSDMARLRQDLRGYNSSLDIDDAQEELSKKLQLAERNAATERARAEMAEQQLRLLESEFESLIRERNTIEARLDESNLAMEEIRYRLASSMNDNLAYFDRSL